MMKRFLLPCALLALGVTASPAAGQVLRMPLPELPADQEMLVLEVDLAPGGESQPHRHDAHTFVYVLEGTVHMQVAGGPLQTLGPGEMFYESPDDIHAVSANASDTEPARILVHMIRTAGTPVSTPAND